MATHNKKPKNPYAQALARLSVAKGGPSIGGRARAEKLTPEQRREAARKAVEARWARWRKTRAKTATPKGAVKPHVPYGAPAKRTSR